MVVGFTKSKEGLAEYQNIGLPYPNNLDDEFYEEWLTATSADDLSKYTSHKEKELCQITVFQVDNNIDDDNSGKSKSKGFIVYSFTHYRLDPACNVVTRFRSNQGKYAIPRAHYKITNMDFGKQERKADYVEIVETGFSIPWTKASLQKIVGGKMGPSMPSNGNGVVQYGIKAPNGISFKVETLEDLMYGSPEELMHFGRIPTEQERKQWLEKEGGTTVDKRKLTEIARKKAEADLVEAPVTASQVHKIIEQQQQANQG